MESSPEGSDGRPVFPNSISRSSDLEQPRIDRDSTQDLTEATPLATLSDFFAYPPEESVYSYLTFMAPIEMRRTGLFMTPLISFAVALVAVNFVMQVGLLYVTGQHIMKKHTEWVGSVAKIKEHAWYHVFPMPYNLPEGNCKTKDSPLCADHKDGVSCAPPSIHLLTDFDLLDINGDGIWAKEEAEDGSLREKIQCEFNVDLPMLYEQTVRSMNSTSELRGRQNDELFAGAGIHQAYFNWYMHKPLLCSYGDQDMCGLLFERGFFDEALQQESLAGFKDTTSAFRYCTHLLQYECFNILPNTYRVWRFKSKQQCGLKLYEQSDYHSPADDSVTPMLHVDFKKRKEYATTETWGFRLFLCILLVTFLSVMTEEMKKIIGSFIWCGTFPSDNHTSFRSDDGRIVGKKSIKITKFRYGTGDDDEQIKKAILAVRADHRIVVFLMTFLRLMLWCFLLWTGIMFLTGPPRYLTLIFDALSLVFIFEIDELLYRTMLRHEFKEDHMSIDPMQVPQLSKGWFNSNIHIINDAAWMIGVIVLGVIIVGTYCHTELDPLLHSLECVCSVQGPNCAEAQAFSKSWWDTYWSSTMPSSNLIIDQLVSS